MVAYWSILAEVITLRGKWNEELFAFLLRLKRWQRSDVLVNISISTGWHKKTVITKNRIASKILFRLTQNFSYIRSSLCSRHLQSFKSVLQKLFVSLTLKKVLQMSSRALQAHLDPAGKVLDALPHSSLGIALIVAMISAFRSGIVWGLYGVVAIHPALKVSPHIEIWGFKPGECGDHCGSHLRLISRSGTGAD